MSRDVQRRARYARTNEPGALRVNAPPGAGIPSGQPPRSGTVVPFETFWYWGSDAPISSQLPQASLSSITRAESLIVNTIAGAPWPVLSGSSDPRLGVTTLPPPRWLNDPMLARRDDRIGLPDDEAALRLPRSAFWAQWIRSVIRYGMGYLAFRENADHQPIAGTLKILHPQWVSSIVKGGVVYRQIGNPLNSSVHETDLEGKFETSEGTYRLVEITNPLAMVDEYGCTPSILTMHARELGLAESAVAYAQSATRSGVPAGILQVSSPTYSKAQADQLREDWLSHHGGDGRSVAVLNSSVAFQPLQWNPEDMALLEMRQMSLLDVANAFGVPPHLLGASTGEGMTYSNAESRSLDFRTYTLLTWANVIEDALSALLPADSYIEVDFRGLSRADTAGRVAYYESGIRNGWLQPGEIRTFESLPPITTSGEPIPIEKGSDPALPEQKPELKAVTKEEDAA